MIFDRSWYNRAGVEHVLGFYTDEQHQRFLELCPMFEQIVVEQGVQIIKYWLEVGNKEQTRRFEARIEDPMRQWKLSPTDLESRTRWYDYSRARDQMPAATDTAPWYLLRSDDKRRARLNLITYLLGRISYEVAGRPKIKVPARDKRNAYDDEASLVGRRWIDEDF